MDPLAVRKESLTILCKVEQEGAYAEVLLRDFAERTGGRDSKAGLVFQLVKGTLEWRERIDTVLAGFLSKDVSKLDLEVRNTLRMGAYQILFLDRIKTKNAVSLSVELIKKSRKKSAAGLVNAVLRKVAGQTGAVSYEQDSPEGVAAEFSHPLWMVKRLSEQFELKTVREFCKANNSRTPLWIRTNTLKVSPSDLTRILAEQGVEVSGGKYLKDALLINHLPSDRYMSDLTAYKEGLFAVQDLSSMIAGSLVEALAGERIIDLCAAPGGKTLQMAAAMQNQGSILAVDLYQAKLDLIQESADRLEISIHDLKCCNVLELEEQTADRVFLDAPCSGLGVLSRRSDARWNKEPEMFDELNLLQRELFEKAASFLCSGGRLVYSTCSVDTSENEEIVSWFLDNNSNFKVVTPDLLQGTDLLTSEGYFRSWPQKHGMNGAFAAVLEKV